MEISFEGKRVLVTGAERGIGREIVKKLVHCKAEVIALSYTQTVLENLQKEYPSIEIIAVDLRDWEATQLALVNVKKVDCLVNNAGIGIWERFLEITEEGCDKLFDVNVKAVINVSQMIVGDLIKRKSPGAIVNISSQASKAALEDHTVYCASKSAVDSITRVMALELGPHNIRVNSVNPTVVLTEMGRAAWSAPEKANTMLSKIPLGRFAEVEEVVNAVLFLLSDKASMISGVSLPVDGGFLAC